MLENVEQWRQVSVHLFFDCPTLSKMMGIDIVRSNNGIQVFNQFAGLMDGGWNNVLFCGKGETYSLELVK